MPAGIQLFDANGNLHLDFTDRITKLLGQIDVSGDGDLVVPEFSQGTPFYFTSPLGLLGSNGWAPLFKRWPVITFNGTTMSWRYPPGGGGYQMPAGMNELGAVRISYGTY